MASIANLAVILSANAGPMTPEVNRASKMLKEFGGVAGSIKGGNFAGVAEGLGKVAGADLAGKAAEWGKALMLVPGPVGAIATGLFQLLPAAIEVGKAIGGLVEMGRKSAGEQMKLSRQFGLTGVQAASMQFMFKGAGTSLDEVRPALTRFQRSLAEAAGGSIEARGKFNQLGISWEALSKQPVSDQLRALALRFREIKDPAEKARLAMLLMGKSGVESLALLDKMANLPNMEQLAQRTNSALTAEDTSRLKAAKQAEMKAGLQAGAMQTGFTQTVAVAAAPIISTANDIATTTMQALQPYVTWFENFVVKPIGNFFAGLREMLGNIWAPVKPAFDAVLNYFDEIFGLMKDLGGEGDFLKDILGGVGSVLGFIIKPIFDLIAWTLNGIIAGVKWLRDGIRDLWSGITGGQVFSSEQKRLLDEQKKKSGGRNPEAIAASAALTEEINRSNQTLNDQYMALGGASWAAEHYALQQRGATVQQLAANAALRQRNLLMADQVTRDNSSDVIQLQLAGMQRTANASMSAAEAQLRNKLATEGINAAMIEVAAASQRDLENLQRRLQLTQQIRDTAENWAAQTRMASAATQLQIDNPGMTGAQAQRQAQIAEMERTNSQAEAQRQAEMARSNAEREARSQAAIAAFAGSVGGLQEEAQAMARAVAQAEGEVAHRRLNRDSYGDEGVNRAQATLEARRRALGEANAAVRQAQEMAANILPAAEALSEEEAFWESVTADHMAGLDRQRLATLRARDAQLALAEAMERGRNLTESMRDPLEMFNDRMGELRGLLGDGGIGGETFGRAAMAAFERLEASSGAKFIPTTGSQDAGAYGYGTIDAIKQIREAQRNQEAAAEPPEARVARVMEAIRQQNEEAQMTRLAILRALGEDEDVAVEWIGS